MSSQSVARSAGVALFELEALEPRRFLSADAQPLEIPLRDSLSLTAKFESNGVEQYLLSIKAGVHYVFESSNGADLKLLNPVDSALLIPATPEEYTPRIDFVPVQSQTAELQVKAGPYFDIHWEGDVDVWGYGDPSGAEVLSDAAPIEPLSS